MSLLEKKIHKGLLSLGNYSVRICCNYYWPRW